MVRKLFSAFLLAALSLGAQAVELASFPQCPGPDVPVGVLVSSYGVPVFFDEYSPASVTLVRHGNRFKAVFYASATIFMAMPSHGVVTFGRLPVGSYHVDVFYRYPNEVVGSVFEPEHPAGSVDISVSISAGSPLVCGPAAMTVVRGGFQSAVLGTSFADPVEILVTDGQQRPVPFADLDLQYRGAPYSYVSGVSTGPQAVLGASRVSTDGTGIARVTATAGTRAGTYQYAVNAAQGVYVRPTFFILRNQEATAARADALVPVVEYQNVTLGQFFITSNADEMRALDDGSIRDWVRTGEVFVAMPVSRNGSPTPGGDPVCRYYGRPEANNNSHFLSASKEECDAVGARFPLYWQLETSEAFRADLPDLTTGACGAGTVPIYRGFNNQPNPNHRYSLSKTMIQSMSTYLGADKWAPWISEGYGPDRVTMCVPQ